MLSSFLSATYFFHELNLKRGKLMNKGDISIAPKRSFFPDCGQKGHVSVEGFIIANNA